jgi:hypothetical protein
MYRIEHAPSRGTSAGHTWMCRLINFRQYLAKHGQRERAYNPGGLTQNTFTGARTRLYSAEAMVVGRCEAEQTKRPSSVRLERRPDEWAAP